MGPAGRPSKEAAFQLVDTLIAFGQSMELDGDTLNKARSAIEAGLDIEYA